MKKALFEYRDGIHAVCT